MKSAFAERLGRLRREKKHSQRRAAEDLGVSQALLSHYENDAREPKLDFVVRACNYYGVTADYLLGRSAERAPQTIPTPSGCEGAPRLISAARDVFKSLDERSDEELYSSVVSFLVVPMETAAALLKDPGIQYNASRDAEMKMAEAELVNLLRSR